MAKISQKQLKIFDMIEFNNEIFCEVFLRKIWGTVDQNEMSKVTESLFKLSVFFIMFKNRLRSINQDILTNELEQR